MLAFRVYRQSREQRWQIGRMWVLPMVFFIITFIVVALDTTQTVLAPVAAIVGLAAGVGIGLYQGNHTTLRMDKTNKAVYIRVTPLGSAIFVAVLALRIGLRIATMGSLSPQQLQSGAMPLVFPGVAAIGGGLLALAAGSIIGLRWYVQRRYDAAPDAAAV